MKSRNHLLFILASSTAFLCAESFVKPASLQKLHFCKPSSLSRLPRLSCEHRPPIHSNTIDNYDCNESKNAKMNHGRVHDVIMTPSQTSRRNVLHSLAASARSTAAASLFLLTSNPDDAPAAVTIEQASVTQQPKKLSSTAGASSYSLDVSSPKITHRVNLNVRISRADGTFYVRDDPPDMVPTPDNQVFTGTITIGLYGMLAPNHVSKFLQYASSNNYDPFEEYPLPTYSKSLFTTFIQANGLLIGGSIPGVSLTSINGAPALEYRGRISSASLWIESNNNDVGGGIRKQIPHYKKGLVTHRDLDALPNFGITTREARELDGSHCVFGEIIETESSNAFLSRVVDLPTYSNTRPVVGVGVGNSHDNQDMNTKNGSVAVEELASSFYSFQKDLFKSAAKSFGDTRLDNIYDGKILRRVEVTSLSIETL